MRKVYFVYIFCISLFLFTSCSSHTITDNPENYIYKCNDAIHIYDNSNTRNLMGVLKITSVNVLSEKPFINKEANGYDESSKPIYREVTYNQIIQVNYTYEIKNSGKSISVDNFNVTDSQSTLGLKNPDANYQTIKVADESYFVVALQNKSNTLNINFNYGIFQMTPTAKIQVDISSISDSSNNTVTSQRSPVTTNAVSLSKNSVSVNIYLVAIIFILLVIVIILIVMLIISNRRRK